MHLQFPIASTSEEFDRQRWHLEGVLAKTEEIIVRAQPYNSRHPDFPPILSILNGFDNSDKHRLLNLALSHALCGQVYFHPPLEGNPDIFWLRNPIRGNTEAAFFTLDPPQTDVDYHFKVSFTITVAHVPGPTGLHVSPLEAILQMMIKEVKRIINEAAFTM